MRAKNVSLSLNAEEYEEYRKHVCQHSDSNHHSLHVIVISNETMQTASSLMDYTVTHTHIAELKVYHK